MTIAIGVLVASEINDKWEQIGYTIDGDPVYM